MAANIPPFLTVCSVILGAIIGSFLNVVILRLPAGESIVFPGSHCPGCQANLAWYDNVPVLSYLMLRGRCRRCAMRISWQYPLVETAMAGLSGALFLRFGPTWTYLIYLVFCGALLAIFVIDLHHQIIPDRISLPGIILGFAVSFVNPLVSWQSSLIGILAGGGTLYLIAAAYYLFTKREGMGGGDIKLLGMIGAFLGWQSLLFVVFASSVLGSLVGILAMLKQRKGGKTVIPYGPFLALAAVIYLFYQAELQHLFVLYFLPPQP